MIANPHNLCRWVADYLADHVPDTGRLARSLRAPMPANVIPLDRMFKAPKGLEDTSPVMDGIMRETAARISRILYEAIENELREVLVRIVGRMPTAAEAACHGTSAIWSDGTREYKWRGKTVLRVVPNEKWGSWRFERCPVEMPVPFQKQEKTT